jgi:hypothetical protein
MSAHQGGVILALNARPKQFPGFVLYTADLAVREEEVMPSSISTILLWLFVVNLGIAFGAGIYEHRIVVPNWISSSDDSGVHWNAEAVRRDNTGPRFWAFVTTGPLTLLTLANLLAAWKASGVVRGWWLAAALAALADRAFTFSYFIPTMIELMRAPDSPEWLQRRHAGRA